MKITVNNAEVEISQELYEQIKKEMENPGGWKPKNGEEYWCVGLSGQSRSSCWCSDEIDCFRASLGNVFKTEEEAEEALKTGWIARLKAETTIRNYIKEKGYEFEPNWKDGFWNKYSLYFDHSVSSLFVTEYKTCQHSTFPISHAKNTQKTQ